MRETLSRMEEERQELILRRKWVHGILLGAGLLLAGRLWFLQVIHGEKLRKYAEINRPQGKPNSCSKGFDTGSKRPGFSGKPLGFSPHLNTSIHRRSSKNSSKLVVSFELKVGRPHKKTSAK